MNATRQNFQRILKQARPYVPATEKQAPSLTAIPKGTGFANVQPPFTPRTINGNPGYRRQLKRMDPSSQQDKSGVRFTTYHELGHIMGAGSEGHANRVANLLLRAERGKLTKPVARRKIANTLNVQDG